MASGGIPVITIDLTADAPKWMLVKASTPQNQTSMQTPYYADGAPTSRHTYSTTQWLAAEHAKDGKARVMLFGSYATYGIGTVGGYSGGPLVDGFRVTDKAWDASGNVGAGADLDDLPSIARDPRDGSDLLLGRLHHGALDAEDGHVGHPPGQARVQRHRHGRVELPALASSTPSATW